MRAVIYDRVSTKKQADKGISLETKDKYLKGKVKQDGHQLVGSYQDKTSAYLKEEQIERKIQNGKFIIEIKTERKDFERLINDGILSKYEIIYFFKWDRMFRHLTHQIETCKMLEEHGIMLKPTDDTQDILARDFVGRISQEESKKTSERVNRIWNERRKEGLYAGRLPIGYKKPNKKGQPPVPNQKAEMIKDIFKRTINGETYRNICKDHNLDPKQYYNILKNKFYASVITDPKTKKEYEGKHEPLITLDVWKKVNSSY